MNVVVIAHPAFLNSRSMHLFADMLSKRFRAKALLAPQPFFYRFNAPLRFRKWLGYIDQYVIFPFALRRAATAFGPDTLFVFADQALGPWVSILRHRPHVIHCHDLTALRSALGEIPENPTGLTGRIYQRFIRRGFTRGRNFISDSEKTRFDLHRLAALDVHRSVSVYLGLNYRYKPIPFESRMAVLKAAALPVDPRGILLHVGGEQWYKNRPGVLALYSAYAAVVPDPLPLWMVGPTSQRAVVEALAEVPPRGKVHLISDLDVKVLNAAYAHAALFLFPSLEEGFGWPIAEAHACGAPVLTTNAAPMTEVGGEAAFYIQRLTAENAQTWAKDGAAIICNILGLEEDARKAVILDGLANAARFDADNATATYERIYLEIIEDARRK